MPVRALGPLGLLLLACALSYMTLGARGNWEFILPFRGVKLVALLLVGCAISTATVLFQTITRNRILTPSIMGFDALYVLILTAAVYFLGSRTVGALPDVVQFLTTLVLLIIGALALFGTLLTSARNDLMRMILTGVIFAVLFRSLTTFLVRMIDPNEYSHIQAAQFARFNRIETDLLWVAGALCVMAMILTWRMRHRLDVLALGHDAAINLGEDPRRGQLQALVLISVLVATSTALVGPVAFLGLLVVNIAHLIAPTARHSVLLIASGLIAGIVLVGGQTILERVLALSTPLSVVIDLFGGLVFLMLILRGSLR